MVLSRNSRGGSRGTSAVKRVFFRGLVALLPTILSIAILVAAGNFIYKYIAKVNWLARWLLIHGLRLERGWVENNYQPLVGFVVAIAMVYVLGYLVATYIGRRMMQGVDRFLTRFPVLGLIYPHLRQIVDFLFTKRSMRWTQVVALEYPRKGVYSIGFVTGKSFKDVRARGDAELVNVFVPSSPTPISGYVIMVPVKELIFLDIRVDEALRFIISGGVLVPPTQQPAVEAGEKPQLASNPEAGEPESEGKTFDNRAAP